MDGKLVNFIESLIDLEVYHNPYIRDKESYFYFKIKDYLKDIRYNLTDKEQNELRELIRCYI